MRHAASYSATYNPHSQLQEVVEEASKVQSERGIVQFFNAAKNVKKTESWIKKLDQHINDFSVGSK